MSTGFPQSPPGATNSTLFPNATFPINGSIWGTLPLNAGRSLQADIIVCSVITWLIASIFVILRFYTRWRLKHILGPTDWCILPALVRLSPPGKPTRTNRLNSSLPPDFRLAPSSVRSRKAIREQYTTDILLEAVRGAGKHAWELQLSDLPKLEKVRHVRYATMYRF